MPTDLANRTAALGIPVLKLYRYAEMTARREEMLEWADLTPEDWQDWITTVLERLEGLAEIGITLTCPPEQASERIDP